MLIKQDAVAWRWVGSVLQQHSDCYRQEGLQVQLLCSAVKLVGSVLQQHSDCYRQEGLQVQLLCSAVKLEC
jgi:hypothetical protein